MSESVSFALNLEDQISAPAKRAADALQRVEKQAEKAQAALAKNGKKQELGFATELERVEKNLHRMRSDPAGYKKLLEAQRELTDARKKLGKEPFFKELGKELGGKFSFAKMLTAAVVADAMVEGVKKAIEVFADGIKDAFKAGAERENTKLAFKLSLGAGGKESMEDIDRFSKGSKYDDNAISRMMLPMLRANFSQKSTRTAFATAGDIEAAGGGDAGETMQLFANLKTKGGIGSKKLVEMLGSSGAGSAPDFYKKLGKRLGVGAGAAEKMLGEGGKIDPQIVMNMVTDAVNKRQGGPAGTGSNAASKTMDSRWHKLGMLPEEYMKNIADSKAWDELSDHLGKVLEKLSPEGEIGKRVIPKLLAAFEGLAKAIEKAFSPENVEVLVNSFAKMVDLMTKMVGLLGAVTDHGKKLQDAAGFAGELNKRGGGDTKKGVRKLLDENLGDKAGLSGMDETWEKVRKAYGIGFWKNLNMSPSDQVDMVNKAIAEGKISGGEASRYSAQAQAAGKTINIHAPVNVAVEHHGGDDPNDTARRIAQETGRHMSNIHERAAQESGAM